MNREVPDAAAMECLGRELARTAGRPGVIYLEGELGTGKTTLVRSLLRGLGYTGVVRSPTYTLVESYETGGLPVHHLDLYRLADPEELEWLGIRDLHNGASLVLVEWPDRGVGWLPPPDVRISFAYRGSGRRVQVRSLTPGGAAMVAAVMDVERIVSR